MEREKPTQSMTNGFLISLRCLAGSDDDPVQSFLEWNIVFEEVACTWRPYYPNLMSPILQKLDKKLADVAYLNVLKWRNRPEANHVRPALYDLSWEAHTRDQVTIIEPEQDHCSRKKRQRTGSPGNMKGKLTCTLSLGQEGTITYHALLDQQLTNSQDQESVSYADALEKADG